MPIRVGLILQAVALFLPQPAMSQAVDKDTVVAAFSVESTMMDPSRASAGIDHSWNAQMFEQLLRYDPDYKQVPWLAKSWKLLTIDGKEVLEVELRQGVKFQNGDPLTSADVEFSYNRFSDPKISRYSHLQANVEKFEVIDDYHFRIHFKEPDGNYLVNNMQMYILPKKYMESVGDEGFLKAPIGTGPWKFVSRTLHQEARFEAFADYWNKDAKPTVKNLVIKIIPEDTTRVAAFKSGAVDWIDNVPPAMVADFKNMPGVKTFTASSGNNLYMDLQTELPNSPFAKLKVRQAAAYAIDMPAIIKGVLFGQGETYAEVGRGTPGYNPDLKQYPYDPKKAKQLLAEAGYPNGFDTHCYNLNAPREPNMKEMGEAVFAYLGQVGIRCQIRGLEYGAWVEMRRRPTSGPSPMDGIISASWGHGLPGDPSTPWGGHLHSWVEGGGWGSYSYIRDEKADAMVEELQRTMDPEKRAELIRNIAHYKHDNVLGGITTYRPIATFAWRDWLNFRAWPDPGWWRAFQEIGPAKG
ncbi:ABC transporter substrate-binding protein [Bradyrhizobium sp. dw_78]|uniref:ABC transporter substrate-binding protein n=1 Tax=Bradyrhizobium sp. dw_78 TaxID=2719793 RepID=UPI00201BBA44|nr:ABC transporter substrate-binding protein [Bradyrhizobium sp. dw_78]